MVCCGLKVSTVLMLLTMINVVAGAFVKMRSLRKFSDAYTVQEKQIGSGSNSVVFSAHPIGKPNWLVAVKKIVKNSSSKAEITFQTSISATNAILGIPKLYDLVETDQHYFVVMQLFKGTTPADWYLSSKHALDATHVTLVMRRLFKTAKILLQLHDRRIIHGDFHDENVLFDERENLIVIDFGSTISLNSESASQESPARFFDSRFSPPERLQRNQVSVLTDSFALGKIAQVFRQKLEYIVVDKEAAAILLEPLDRFIRQTTRSDVNKRWSCKDLLKRRGEFGLDDDDKLDLKMAKGSYNLKYLYEPEQVVAT